MNIKVDTSCCGKEMLALGEVASLDCYTNSIQRWLCPECGRCLDLVDYGLDEEVLENLLDLYGKVEPVVLPDVHSQRKASESKARLQVNAGLPDEAGKPEVPGPMLSPEDKIERREK